MTPPAPTPEQPKHRADGPARVFVGAKVGGAHKVGVFNGPRILHPVGKRAYECPGCIRLAAAARVAEDERRAL